MTTRFRIDGRWVFLIPILSFVFAASWYRAERTDVQVAMERAKEAWRSARYQEAVAGYLELQSRDPSSPIAAECLWEAASIYYYNIYDLSNALHLFERLTVEYPDSQWGLQSHLVLGDIFEKELNEINNAVVHWREALAGNLDDATRQEVELKIADAYFKMNEFDLAMEDFQRIALASPPGDAHLVHRAKLRLSTLFQIRREYDKSIQFLEQVLNSDPCAGCRLQAQLGLIESYEFKDQLDDAIRIAQNISPEDYPAERRQELLKRLIAKKEYYKPGKSEGF